MNHDTGDGRDQPASDRPGDGNAALESDATLEADGGAAGADELTLDPWGSSTVSDYRKLFDEFGIESFDEVLDDVPNPHYLMRRGVIFGHREYDRVARALAADEPVAALSGFMPTGEPHIGHKMVFDELIWHQQQGADAYALIADLEAHAARGLTWEEIDEYTREYLLSLLALGFDPADGDLYRQSTNRQVQDLAFELGAEANFSELQAIYGFDGETDVSHAQSVVTQMADICYPQLEEPKPTVIPVGPDQDPHVRLARDLAARMRYFKVTEAFASFEVDDRELALLADYAARLDPADVDDDTVRCLHVADAIETDLPDLRPLSATDFAYEEATVEAVLSKLREAGKEPVRHRVRFFNRRGTDEALDALIETIDGDIRVYDDHVDAFDLDRERGESLAREVELDCGGYGFLPPSSIYHRFMTGLTGGKMSSSIPASHISLLDDPDDGYEKVKSAATGGRETAEKQRELGGVAEECPVYELYAYLLAGDDDEFATNVYEECVGGERLCGECKEQAAQLMKSFLESHQERREAVKADLEALDIDLESPRRR